MNNLITIRLPSFNKKIQPYMRKQARLVSYYSGLPVSNILEMIQEYDIPYTYTFKNN